MKIVDFGVQVEQINFAKSTCMVLIIMVKDEKGNVMKQQYELENWDNQNVDEQINSIKGLLDWNVLSGIVMLKQHRKNVEEGLA